MAIIKYHNVGITAMSACVPSKVVSNRDLGYLIPEEEIEKTINNIGIAGWLRMMFVRQTSAIRLLGS